MREVIFLRHIPVSYTHLDVYKRQIIILVTPENKVPWAMGLYQASMVMGLVFGPLMGGLVADLLGYRAPFVMFSALTGLCMLGIYLFMPNLQFEHKVDARE